MCLHAVNLIDPPGKRKTFHLVQKTESAVRTAVRHYGLTEHMGRIKQPCSHTR